MGMRFSYMEVKDGLVHLETSGVNVDTRLLRAVGAEIDADGEDGIVVVLAKDVHTTMSRLQEVLKAREYGGRERLEDGFYPFTDVDYLLDIQALANDKVNQHIAGFSMAAIFNRDFTAA